MNECTYMVCQTAVDCFTNLLGTRFGENQGHQDGKNHKSPGTRRGQNWPLTISLDLTRNLRHGDVSETGTFFIKSFFCVCEGKVGPTPIELSLKGEALENRGPGK